MNVHQCKKPDGTGSDDLDFDGAPIPEGLSELWYWYESGCYAGSGELIARFGDEGWDTCGLSHCSCNDALDDIPFLRPQFESIKKLTEGYTKERIGEIQTLLDAIRSIAHKQHRR